MISILGIPLAFLLTCFEPATIPEKSQPVNETTRCKVGLRINQSGKVRSARPEDTVVKGDALRIYVQPEMDGFLYIIHSDKKLSSLLNDGYHQVKKGEYIIFPDSKSELEVDGKSRKEILTIVFSSDKRGDIQTLFEKDQVPAEEWEKIEKRLKDQSSIKLSEGSDKPFAIAGNVRGDSKDPFFQDLKVSAGIGLVLKRYVLTVKK